MKNILILLFISISVVLFGFTQFREKDNTSKNVNPLTEKDNISKNFNPLTDKLFKVVKNDKFGFINVEGEIIIPIKYHSAGGFSSGLCPVRLNGTYGFINSRDEFVIPAQFDYARSFEEGLALAYMDGKSFFIDTTGQKVFDVDFRKVENFKNGWARIWTATNKQGLLNRQGEFAIDTIFREIRDFKNGLAVVEGLNHHPYEDSLENYEIGIIDTLGNLIFSYGKFSEMDNFNDGLAHAYTIPDDKNETRYVYIDMNGKVILDLKKYIGHPNFKTFQEGLVSLDVYKDWVIHNNERWYSENDDYEIMINTKGENVINDTIYEYFSSIHDGRFFGIDKDNNHYLLDTKGNKIIEKPFGDVIGKGFQNGLAAVEKSYNSWGFIDINGDFIVPAKYTAIHEVGIIDDYFFFGVRDENRYGHHQNKKYGIVTLNGDTIINAMMHEFSPKGFQNGLLICKINDKSTYINRKGEIVWQEEKVENNKIATVDIDFMMRNYFYASGEKRIENNLKDNFLKKTLSVKVSKEQTILNEKYKAQKVFLANTTDSAILFDAQDRHIDMKVQALDKYGKWKDIEYLPSSWCGNSYHELTLEVGKYWEFATPIYTGDFKTKLRIKMAYIHPEDNKKRRGKRRLIFIYSNEYEGSINPAQFWRKSKYYSRDLMNPYND
jgi:hypothetical protein